MAENSRQVGLGLHAAEDEMRMLVNGWDQMACRFNARVAGLNGLLKVG